LPMIFPATWLSGSPPPDAETDGLLTPGDGGDDFLSSQPRAISRKPSTVSRERITNSGIMGAGVYEGIRRAGRQTVGGCGASGSPRGAATIRASRTRPTPRTAGPGCPG